MPRPPVGTRAGERAGEERPLSPPAQMLSDTAGPETEGRHEVTQSRRDSFGCNATGRMNHTKARRADSGKGVAQKKQANKAVGGWFYFYRIQIFLFGFAPNESMNG